MQKSSTSIIKPTMKFIQEESDFKQNFLQNNFVLNNNSQKM